MNPFQTNRYRELLAKKAKTDDIDAYIIAGLLRSGEARSCYVPDDQIQGLRDLVRLRNTYLDNLQTYRRQATSLLQLVFPEVGSVVKDPFGKAMCAILQQYPTAADLAKVHPRKIEKIARSFQGNNFDRAKAEALVAASKSSIYAGRAKLSRGKVLASLLSQIAQLESAIEELDATIAASLDDSTKGRSDTNRLTSIPGIGPKTAAVLLAEIGEVSRFHSADHRVGYFGLSSLCSKSREENRFRLPTSVNGVPSTLDAPSTWLPLRPSNIIHNCEASTTESAALARPPSRPSLSSLGNGLPSSTACFATKPNIIPLDSFWLRNEDFMNSPKTLFLTCEPYRMSFHL